MIARPSHLASIRAALARAPVVVLTGSHQCGKTMARNEQDSVSWRNQFIRALVERDLPLWGVRVPAVVYPGAKRFSLANRVEAVPLDTLADPGSLFA
jgi:hypothetical protein